MLFFAVVVALDPILPRRQLGALCSVAIAPQAAVGAMAEWTCPLDKQEWTIAKRQESSIRIRPETMLLASDGSKREVKLLKIPLGRAAVNSFEPEEQVELARFFASKRAADDIGVEKVAGIFRNSLDRQAKSDASPLIAASVNVPSAVLETRQNRRYVTVDYDTDGCRRLDEDGQCVGRAKRVANAVITVSLESQARTLEEQRRMDRGELEARYIDTLWILTASAPTTSKAGKVVDLDAARQRLRGITSAFLVLDA